MVQRLSLAARDVGETSEYLGHNERGIVFESLCSAVLENRVIVDGKILQTICEMGEELKMDSDLRTQIQSV